MGKNKLAKFAEMKTFPHVFEPELADALNDNFPMKGHWNPHFFKNDHPIVLELGCGRGEYTLNLSRRYPNKNYIGIDIKGARIWNGAKKSLEEGLPNVAFLRTRIEHLASFFGPGEISEIWLTFPDPQLKKPRKRLSSARFLSLYRRILSPQGQIHLKTDSQLLYRFTSRLIALNQLPLLKKSGNVHAEWPDDELMNITTFYEEQFMLFDLPITYLKFQLVGPQTLQDPKEDKVLAKQEKALRDEIMPKIPVQGKPQFEARKKHE